MSRIPPAHSLNSKEFHELTFSQQASSITSMLNNLKSSISFHIKNSKNPKETKIKCESQVNRFLERIQNIEIKRN